MYLYLRDMVDQAVKDLRAEEEAARAERIQDPSYTPRFWASSVGKCPRKAHYERRGETPTDPFDERLQRVFRVGSIFEEWILEMLRRQVDEIGGRFYEQVRLVNEHFTARTDGLVVLDGEVIPIEIKTIHSGGFLYKDLPYEWHRHQLDTFLWLWRTGHRPEELPDDLPDRLDYGKIIYVSKDDLLTREFAIYHLSPGFLSRVAYLVETWEAGELPPRPVEDPRLSPLCARKKGRKKADPYRPACPFFGLCWGEEGYEVLAQGDEGLKK